MSQQPELFKIIVRSVAGLLVPLLFAFGLPRIAPARAGSADILSASTLVATQSPTTVAGTVLRLRVRVKIGDSTKGLSRKRFFLTKGSLEQNKAIIDEIERRTLVTRDCYYRSAGASDAFIKWLNESDCESVYCREVEAGDVAGPGAVPEFVNAMAAGEKQFGSRELARKWITVNLPENLRSGFYNIRQNYLRSSLKQAEQISGAPVLSVMTDRNGTAYFTDLEPGTYTLSNILPAEMGNMNLIWNCEVQVKPDERAFEKPFLLSNRKEKNVKCVAVEKPLPVCASTAK
ncbi:MAG TPA: prealbumin-like fold domain-containing protein [Pyrinomonadaceae bacterium]|jgi:hypothetical protein